jgi:hypothetical protein
MSNIALYSHQIALTQDQEAKTDIGRVLDFYFTEQKSNKNLATIHPIF